LWSLKPWRGTEVYERSSYAFTGWLRGRRRNTGQSSNGMPGASEPERALRVSSTLCKTPKPHEGYGQARTETSVFAGVASARRLGRLRRSLTL
jgi:hypothetical protein